MSEKKKLEMFTTPAGTASWPRLDTPDTKFKAEGEFSCSVILEDTPSNSAFMKRLSAAAETLMNEFAGEDDDVKKAVKARKFKKAEDLPFGREIDKETGEETGNWFVKAKMTASGTNKKTGKPWSMKPAIFDAAAKPVKGAVRIGGGSKVQMAFELMPFFTTLVGLGVSCRLKAVQVIDLVEYGGGISASAAGFQAQEGFSADEVASAADGDGYDGAPQGDGPEGSSDF